MGQEGLWFFWIIIIIIIITICVSCWRGRCVFAVVVADSGLGFGLDLEVIFLGLDLASSLLAVLTFLLVVETGFYPLDACVLKSVMLVSPRKI